MPLEAAFGLLVLFWLIIGALCCLALVLVASFEHERLQAAVDRAYPQDLEAGLGNGFPNNDYQVDGYYEAPNERTALLHHYHPYRCLRAHPYPRRYYDYGYDAEHEAAYGYGSDGHDYWPACLQLPISLLSCLTR
ncbi:hypothetical protein GGR54DRAFT_617068 [Hypoxylon sp. NC1633]|nr:hypothetical protein GGR54DRAFT_617068 [Hypoxylon sp. NC1633]